MRRFIWLTIALLLLGLAVPVSAQQTIILKTVQVEFWPEFDQPSMLVIYTIELPEDAPLPGNVTLQIPADVGEPNAVAVAESDRLLTTDYTREVSGDWADIVVVAETNTVRVEYYDRSLSRDDFEREYEFSWLGTYAVEDFIVRVQTPVGATNMTFSHEMDGPQIASDGLGYYLGSFGSLGLGERFDFSIMYEKSDTTLSFDALSAEDGVVENPESTGLWQLLSDGRLLILILAGFGFILVYAGFRFLREDYKRSVRTPISKYAKKSRSRSRSGTPGRVSKKPAKFCHNCGTPAKTGDKFCRECGRKLRV